MDVRKFVKRVHANWGSIVSSHQLQIAPALCLLGRDAVFRRCIPSPCCRFGVFNHQSAGIAVAIAVAATCCGGQILRHSQAHLSTSKQWHTTSPKPKLQSSPDPRRATWSPSCNPLVGGRPRKPPICSLRTLRATIPQVRAAARGVAPCARSLWRRQDGGRPTALAATAATGQLPRGGAVAQTRLRPTMVGQWSPLGA